MSCLSKEEVMGLKALARKNAGKVTNCEVARLFRVTEGPVRYHLKRDRKGALDKRKDKSMKANPYAHIIENWIEDSKGNNLPPSIQELYDYLFEEHEYEGSYRSVLRYVRKDCFPIASTSCSG